MSTAPDKSDVFTGFTPFSTVGPYRAVDYWQLEEGAPYELIRGRLIMSPCPTPLHQVILSCLCRAFAEIENKKGGLCLLAPMDVVLSDDTILQPDLLFVSQERRSIITKHIVGPPDLAVEILSPATGRRDKNRKTRPLRQVRRRRVLDRRSGDPSLRVLATQRRQLRHPTATRRPLPLAPLARNRNQPGHLLGRNRTPATKSVSEPTAGEAAEAELPRLRIHHFFILTTVFAVVISAHLGIWNLLRAYQPSQTFPELTTGISLLFLVQAFSQSACIAIALLGLTWRRQGIPFPSQPGHWMALYLTIVAAYEIALTLSFIFQLAQAFGWESTHWVTMPMGWIFRCITIVFWATAFLYEPSRIWTWGWAVMALKSLFSILRALFFLGARCVAWLLEVFWYQVDFTSQFRYFHWGSYANFRFLLPNYLLLAFLLTATISDLRQHRQLHWSHWLVLISTFVSTAILTVNMYFVLP